jgi:hypothetical protein
MSLVFWCLAHKLLKILQTEIQTPTPFHNAGLMMMVMMFYYYYSYYIQKWNESAVIVIKLQAKIIIRNNDET